MTKTKADKELKAAIDASSKQVKAERAFDYIDELPKEVPAGRILVHNWIRPVAVRQGTRGSRYWLSSAGTTKYAICDCGWSPELGVHYTSVGHHY